MNIIETDKYKKSCKKLISKNKKYVQRIDNIKNLLISKDNLYDVMKDPMHNVYHIEQLKNNRHDYSARIDNASKLRLIMTPVGKYPYNIIEITDIVFDDIDNYHYERG